MSFKKGLYELGYSLSRFINYSEADDNKIDRSRLTTKQDSFSSKIKADKEINNWTKMLVVLEEIWYINTPVDFFFILFVDTLTRQNHGCDMTR